MKIESIETDTPQEAPKLLAFPVKALKTLHELTKVEWDYWSERKESVTLTTANKIDLHLFSLLDITLGTDFEYKYHLFWSNLVNGICVKDLKRVFAKRRLDSRTDREIIENQVKVYTAYQEYLKFVGILCYRVKTMPIDLLKSFEKYQSVDKIEKYYDQNSTELSAEIENLRRKNGILLEKSVKNWSKSN